MRVIDVLESGLSDGTHIGRPAVRLARRRSRRPTSRSGDARDGVEMRTDSMMTWFSMTKAVTSVAVAQQWERGALDVDDPVVRHIPEFGAQGKEVVTLRHLLTHTAGLPNADGILAGHSVAGVAGREPRPHLRGGARVSARYSRRLPRRRRA